MIAKAKPVSYRARAPDLIVLRGLQAFLCLLRRPWNFEAGARCAVYGAAKARLHTSRQHQLTIDAL